MGNRDFFSWTIKTIRDDVSSPVWLEDRKTEWVPLVEGVISRMLDGYSVIIMSDEERSWFVNYAVAVINPPNPLGGMERPFFPIYPIASIYTQITQSGFVTQEKLAFLLDMLSISFGEKYFFWYIGKADSMCAKLSFSKDHSFNWLLDEERQSSFRLHSNDELLDIKLLQLLRIFNKSLSAALFGEISLGN